jgi:hypothetical protein
MIHVLPIAFIALLAIWLLETILFVVSYRQSKSS